jgi:hypothetical protein
MRCHEAKRLLNEGEISNRKLAEHIQQCPDCAREAQAAGLIRKSMDSLRNEDTPEATPFSEIRSSLETHSATPSRKEYSRMAEITRKMAARKKFSFGLGLAAAALLLFTLVPFSYDRVVGYDVEISGINPNQTININPIVQAMSGLGYDNISVSTNYASSGTSVQIMNLPDKKAAQEASAVFSTLTGLSGDVEFSPKVEAVSGSLFAQVKEQLFTVEIEASGGTPEEIQANIEAQLASMGISGAEATVNQDGDQMDIQITIPGDE